MKVTTQEAIDRAKAKNGREVPGLGAEGRLGEIIRGD